MVDVSHPSQDAIDAVQSLIDFNIGCADGYREAADHVMGNRLEPMFRNEARLHDEFALALKAALIVRTGNPEPSSSTGTGRPGRWWRAIKRFGVPQDEQAILAEAEQGIEAVKKRYEDLHQWPMGSPLAELLTHQHRVMAHSVERLRGMRECAESSVERR